MEDIWLDSKFKEKKRNIKRRNNEKKKGLPHTGRAHVT